MKYISLMSTALAAAFVFASPVFAMDSAPSPTPPPNPFTADGTASVTDHATDEEGKEFYTITAADDTVFYLVIDSQKTGSNVYFLDPVTVTDLLSLAQQDLPVSAASTPEPTASPQPKPTAVPRTVSGPRLPGSALLMGAAILAAGALGYYCKVYRPRHSLDDAADIDEVSFAGPEEPALSEDGRA